MRQHKLWWQSSYDRGLDMVLDMWPEIKKAYPDATLDICYGWDLFEKIFANNPERMEWKSKLDKQMEAEGITHHGKISQDKMKELRKECGIWVYPTYFTEINCIGALECQSDGVVPCVINKAALKETVGSGKKINGDIYDESTKKEYLDELLELMNNKEEWKVESEKAIGFAKDYQWSIIASKWDEEFK